MNKKWIKIQTKKNTQPDENTKKQCNYTKNIHTHTHTQQNTHKLY